MQIPFAGSISILTTAALGAAACATGQPGPGGPPEIGPLDWRETEKGVLENHVQLTFEGEFNKAGEAYFSPDGQWIIFQAVPAPTPAAAGAPDAFYSMYIAKLQFEGERIVGLDDPILVSPPGSANTCGWFHPTEPGTIIFGSTIKAPSPSEPPGFQRQSSKYVWMFPPETEIVKARLLDVMSGTESITGGRAAIDPARLHPITDNKTYDAECSYSPDGRHLLYTSVEPEPNGGDIFVLDTKTGERRKLIEAPGYDGGPFFSPDGRRITYRSDRDGTNLLQIFVADLEFDAGGAIIGVEREHQVTDNEHVNWCPFWSPDGRHLIYATSEVGHFNYEIYIVTADPGEPGVANSPLRYGLQKRRVTRANGFDGLPAFSPDGKRMMWTSQRVDDPKGQASSQLWIADFVMEIDPERVTPSGY